MLSQKSRYALKALLVLAARGDSDPMQISDIADTANVPRKFLEQILLELKKPGIVRSHRGRLGGYSLGRPAKDISFADVLRVTDGPLALSPCVSVMAYRKCDDCFDEAICGIRNCRSAGIPQPGRRRGPNAPSRSALDKLQLLFVKLPWAP